MVGGARERIMFVCWLNVVRKLVFVRSQCKYLKSIRFVKQEGKVIQTYTVLTYAHEHMDALSFGYGWTTASLTEITAILAPYEARTKITLKINYVSMSFHTKFTASTFLDTSLNGQSLRELWKKTGWRSSAYVRKVTERPEIRQLASSDVKAAEH